MKRFDKTTLEGNEARLNHGDGERVRLKEEGMETFPKDAIPLEPKLSDLLPYVHRRERLCRHYIPCRRCQSTQVQLLPSMRPPAVWCCRMCHYEFVYEPLIPV
jgi:hypothetical protein